jgi:hypothetical protein
VNWTLVDPFHVVSDCGRYRIARTGHGEEGAYTAWKGRTKGQEVAVRLGSHAWRTGDDAAKLAALKATKQLCIDDARTP